MALSIRLQPQDEALLERAASHLRVSKSEFIRRSVAAYARQVIPTGRTMAEIDSLFIGKGGGLRTPGSVTNPQKRAVLERLREKHRYTD